MVKQIDRARLLAWVEGLIGPHRVFGIQAKEDRFVFAPLRRASDLRLDYDLSVLPPKKYFQPVTETLVQFTRAENAYEAVVDEAPFVLLGVHPYDLAAIRQMDAVFSTDNEDVHYLTRRGNATIIASDIQNASPNSFASCMGTATAAEGFDILITKLDDVYVIDARTEKGEALMKGLVDAPDADAKTLARREQFWAEAQKKFVGHKLNCSPEELPAVLAGGYEHPVWKERARAVLLLRLLHHGLPDLLLFQRLG